MIAADDERLRMPIDELALSVRVDNCFRHEVVYDGNGGSRPMRTVGDLLTKSERELLRIPNFGRKSLAEVREMLQQMGLHLEMEIGDAEMAAPFEWDY